METQTLKITTALFVENAEKLAVITLESPENKPNFCMQNKTVFFLCDVSASMYDTLSAVKASLFTFRDFIPILQNFYIGTFSDDAKFLWSSNSSRSFDEAVNSMEDEGSTNMGAGIEMAFECFRTQEEDKASWLVILTDGVSNKGNFQTKESFVALADRKPKNTKIITLGYGDDFDANILNAIGDFTYLKDRESISGFMGALALEISTCSIINVRTDSRLKMDFGTQNVGNFANERKYSYGLKIPKNVDTDTIHIFYTEIYDSGLIERGQHIPIDFRSLPISPMPTWVKQSQINYYTSVYIKNLYSCSNTEDLQKCITVTREAIKDWPDHAAENKETIRRICYELFYVKKIGLPQNPRGMQLANSLSSQTSYTDARYATPSSAKAYRHAIDISKKYSPDV